MYCSLEVSCPAHFRYFIFHIPVQQAKSKVFFCLCVCGNKWWCEMNEKRDSLMIMRRLIFLEYPVRAQPIGCQIKAPVSMTKCSPFPPAPATIYQTLSSMCVFLPPNLLHTLDFGGRLSLLFAVNFCRLHQGSSPWIFISPLTPLNVNSSFPVLLFISVAWWFDHAGNTRLAIALSLVLPQGHLLLKCYCLCCLTPRVPVSYSP